MSHSSDSLDDGCAMGHPLGATGAMLVGAEMLTGRHGDRLGSWKAAVASEDLPHLSRESNATTPQSSRLTQSYNSGASRAT
ncbi:hypothetical protein [Rhodococcus erythropolis]|uniref:hypothetical protein n=1 Tax=Rhodococcus erythropolis TaxID=1833 RepID=UPI0024B76E0C|nr:hypothetical protein [Rhodococcus erythropolis]MDJ0015483.1 hypothetical protein [Rhodococcus erythropolis]